MKKMVIYALEGCGQCKNVTNELEELSQSTGIELVKKFCGREDPGCDALEDGLGTEKYPIVLLNNFDYFKDKFNKPNGIVYICNNYEETYTPVPFASDIVGVGVIDKSGMIKLLKEIVK
jgi:hypothetical protein